MEMKLYILVAIVIIVVLAYIITPAGKLFNITQNLERSSANLSLKTVSIKQGEIAYLESNDKSLPTLLFVHGFGANKDNWTRVSKHLSDKYHIVALDLPGFGESFKSVDLEYGILNQVERLHEFVKAIGLTNFHIAGNSMGGLISANYAVSHPSNVKSLWLLNTLGVASAPLSEMAEMIKNKKPPILIVNSQQNFDDLIDFLFQKKPIIPKFARQHLAKEAIANAKNNAKIFYEIRKVHDEDSMIKLEKILIGFSKPLLITWGDKDRVLHYKGAEILKTIVPHAHLNIMSNVGHMPMVEVPKQTAIEFMEFDSNNDYL